MFAEKNNSFTLKLSIRKAAVILDKIAMKMTLKDYEIKRLREELDQVKPQKRRKVVQNPNERFTSLAQVLTQANREPEQRRR